MAKLFIFFGLFLLQVVSLPFSQAVSAKARKLFQETEGNGQVFF